MVFVLYLLFVSLLIYSNVIMVTNAAKGGKSYIEGVGKRSKEGGRKRPQDHHQ